MHAAILRKTGDTDLDIVDDCELRDMGSGDVNVSGGAKCSVSKAGSGNVHCS